MRIFCLHVHEETGSYCSAGYLDAPDDFQRDLGESIYLDHGQLSIFSDLLERDVDSLPGIPGASRALGKSIEKIESSSYFRNIRRGQRLGEM